MSQRPDDEMVPHPARRRVRVVSLAIAAGMTSRAQSALSSKGWAGPAHLPYNKMCTRIATRGLPLSFCSSVPVFQQVETAAAAGGGGATQAFAGELTMLISRPMLTRQMVRPSVPSRASVGSLGLMYLR